MTILSVAQDMSAYIGIDRPLALVSSTEVEHQELVSVANRAADYIARAYDWQKLSVVGTLTGDGTITSFDFPADFSKFTDDAGGEARILTPVMAGPMYRIQDMNDWLEREVRQIGRVTYSWIMYGGQIHIKPALPAATDASFFYQSANIISDGGVTPTYKAAFTADSDVFRLDERMLMLCMLWMWRHSKQQSYAEYMAEFEKRKAEITASDKGPRSISFAPSRLRQGIPIAYPFELS